MQEGEERAQVQERAGEVQEQEGGDQVQDQELAGAAEQGRERAGEVRDRGEVRRKEAAVEKTDGRGTWER